MSCFCTGRKISVRINLPLFSTVVPSNICMFLSCRPFVVVTTFWTSTRPVENVVITTKGLQDRNIHIIDGTTVENKGKLILFLYLILCTYLYSYILSSLIRKYSLNKWSISDICTFFYSVSRSFISTETFQQELKLG